MNDRQQTNRAGLAQRFSEMENVAGALKAQGLLHCVAEDSRLDGRSITLRGRSLVNFGSCSYLGLETDARLKAAACEAVLRYGTQFSSSRAYVSAPLYAEFEQLLDGIVGGHPLVVAQTTSLGHLSALPVLVGERDAVLFDAYVHHSVQSVLPALRAQGAVCEMVPHNDLGRVEERARALAANHERVFYLCDGVYSMHGDTVDVPKLRALLDSVPALHAYVDDAHGVGWSGRHGAGHALADHVLHERMVAVLGFAKGFAASGAAIVCPTQELAHRIFTCGGTMMFSGPLQPALLGAGIAAARILLSDELSELQADVRERIELFDACAAREGLNVPAPALSPIRFIPVGREEATLELASHLHAAGYYINISMFPAVPKRAAGIRVMLNRHQALDDIRGLVAEAAARMRRVGVEPPSRSLQH